MTINVGNLELILQQKISSTTSEEDLLILSTALSQLNTGMISVVSTFTLLPSASLNKGALYFVEADRRLYWSTGDFWIVIVTDSISILWTWGANDNGQLGTGNTTTRSSPGTTADLGPTWTSVCAGWFFNAGIKTDGTLWTWGRNTSGQMGDGTVICRSSPVTTAGGGTNWCSASAGNSQITGIKTDGTLWTWGYNGGQLGDGTIIARSSPGTTSGGGTNWRSASSGNNHTAGIKTDGTLWTWGSNGSGQLGNGTSTNRSSPGTTAGGGTNWGMVSSGFNHLAGTKTDGTLWTWGNNSFGILGDGTTTNRSSPGTTAGGGTDWSSVSGGYKHTAAIKTDGTLWTWGQNTWGQLGTGNTTSRSSPGTTAGGGTNWSSVSTVNTHTAGVKTDGTLWTWGSNSNGQAGDSTTGNYRTSPGTTAGGGTNWIMVSAGGIHTAAIRKQIV